ncbi:MAG TPA: hypothetical protein VGL99_20730 [Chloroflexota bacterium]
MTCRSWPFCIVNLGFVTLANLAWLTVPLVMLARMARTEHPFTTSASD